MSVENTRIKYFKNFNTTRFIATILMLMNHNYVGVYHLLGKFPDFHTPLFTQGRQSLNYFFVMSGFLITYLLSLEYSKTNTIELKAFYMRRVLRIWPIYFLIFIVGLLFYKFILPSIIHEPYLNFPLWKGFLMFLFFMPNYAEAFFRVGFLGPLWSIGIEEQFYLLFAPLFKFFRKYLYPILIVLLLVITYIHFYNQTHGLENVNYQKWHYIDSFRFQGIILGCLAALLFFKYQHFIFESFMLNKYFQIFVIIVIVARLVVPNFVFHELAILDNYVTYIFYILFLIQISAPNSLFKGESKFFYKLGNITYGMYVFHMLPDWFIRFVFPKVLNLHVWSANQLYILYFIISTTLTITIAHFSYKYFESYFLKMKKKTY